MNPTHRKLRRRNEIQRRKSASGVAERERLRMERNADLPTRWPLVRSLLLSVYAAPDGRHMALQAADGAGTVYRCGSERAVRGALSSMLYVIGCGGPSAPSHIATVQKVLPAGETGMPRHATSATLTD